MVAFRRRDLLNHADQAGIAFKRGRIQMQLGFQVPDAHHAADGIFKRHAAHNSVDFVPFGKEELGEIRAVLSSDAGNQRGFYFSQFNLLMFSGQNVIPEAASQRKSDFGKVAVHALPALHAQRNHLARPCLNRPCV